MLLSITDSVTGENVPDTQTLREESELSQEQCEYVMDSVILFLSPNLCMLIRTWEGCIYS